MRKSWGPGGHHFNIDCQVFSGISCCVLWVAQTMTGAFYWTQLTIWEVAHYYSRNYFSAWNIKLGSPTQPAVITKQMFILVAIESLSEKNFISDTKNWVRLGISSEDKAFFHMVLVWCQNDDKSSAMNSQFLIKIKANLYLSHDTIF